MVITPGLFIKAFGYNDSVPGPTIIVKPNDKVYIRVINNLTKKQYPSALIRST